MIPNFEFCVVPKHVPSRVRDWIAGQRREAVSAERVGTPVCVWQLVNRGGGTWPPNPHRPPLASQPPQPTQPPTPSLTLLHRLPLCSHKVKQPARQGRRCDVGSLICHLTKQPHTRTITRTQGGGIESTSDQPECLERRVDEIVLILSPPFFQSWVSQPLH